MKFKGYKYDGSIDRYPISEGECYRLENGSTMATNDIFGEVPEYMKQADCIFIDPPCSKSNLSTFYTKADKEQQGEYALFEKRIWHYIDTIAPKRLFCECFYANHKRIEEEARKRFPFVKVYEVTYYNKYKCWIVQGTQEKEEYDFEGKDELFIIENLLSKDVPLECICDFCMGRGGVAVGAYKAGKRFVGGEMNENRLAVGIAKVAHLGGNWVKGEL